MHQRCFSGSIFNGDISEWDVRNLKMAIGMFQRSSFNRDISGWNVSNIKDSSFMFCGAELAKNKRVVDAIIYNWKMPNLIYSNFMFSI